MAEDGVASVSAAAAEALAETKDLTGGLLNLVSINKREAGAKRLMS